METVSNVSPATAAPAGTSNEVAEEEEEESGKRAYSRLPLFLLSDLLDRALLVNPEETDPEKFILASIPPNFSAETHRLRRRDFADETHYLELRATAKRAEAERMLKEVTEEEARIVSLRKLPLDQRTAVVEFQKGRAKMAKLEAQLRAMGLPIDV